MDIIIDAIALGVIGSFAAHVIATAFRLPFMLWRLARRALSSGTEWEAKLPGGYRMFHRAA